MTLQRALLTVSCSFSTVYNEPAAAASKKEVPEVFPLPQVSILIPAFNAEKMIISAVDSALSQTLKDIEVIVIDDASTDGTAALVADRAKNDSRLRLYRREVNGGPAAGRNSGIAIAQSEWIGLLDADDVIMPNRFEYLISSATEQDVLVADNLQMYDMHAERIVKAGIDPKLLGEGLRLTAAEFVLRCRTNQSDAIDFGLLKPILRASHIRRYGIAYDERIRHSEDFHLYLDALIAGGSLLVLPEPMYRYTERIGSISGKASGVSATQPRYDIVEAQTRALIDNPRYSSVAHELEFRAEAMRRFAKFAAFHKRSRLAKLATLPLTFADREMRNYLSSRLFARISSLFMRNRQQIQAADAALKRP